MTRQRKLRASAGTAEAAPPTGTPVSRRFAPWPALLLIAYAVLVAVPTAALMLSSSHSTSRLATVESLVENGTFAIDRSTYADTIDKVRIGPHFYSHQPPGHALLTAILYFPLSRLGLTFHKSEATVYFILTFLTNGLSTVVALIFFYRGLAWFNLSQGQRLLVAAGVACGTLVLPYSTTFNVHGLVAAWLFIGFYCFLRAGMEDRPRHWTLLSGLAFSACAALDHGTVFLYAAFGALLLALSDRRRELFWFLVPACVTLLPTALYYYAIGGSFKPFAARPELFAYPGSPWTDPNSIVGKLTGGAWNSPWFTLSYGFLCLFGPRGFLIYNPLIWVALYGMVITIRNRFRFWREAAAIAAGSAAMMLYYFVASTNYGGFCYSIRWFVALLFLWGFFGAAAVGRLASRKWLAVPIAALAGVSVVYALGGVANPWPAPEWMGYLLPIVNFNGLRAPLDTLSLSVSPNPVPRAPDGSWPVFFSLRETGGVPAKLTVWVVGGVYRTENIVRAFGGDNLLAYGAASTTVNVTGYKPPFDLECEIWGVTDSGRVVKSAATVKLLP